jgi:hypothetical protein
VERRRIDRHNESPSTIPQQEERVIPPALAGARGRGSRITDHRLCSTSPQSG